MPYNYAHALTGFSALHTVPELLPVGNVSCYHAFFLGTMGPDPYYGDIYPPPLRATPCCRLADLMHECDLGAFLSALLSLSEGNDIRRAYAFGMLCHVLLDNHVHPYIEARFPGKAHTPAEIAMDMPLLARAHAPELSVSPKQFYSLDVLPEIDALHAALFSRLFSLSTAGLYTRSAKKWLRLNAFLYDPLGKKRAFTRPIPSLSWYFIAPTPDADALLNLSHAPWSETDARRASVPERIAEADAEIARCLSALLQNAPDAVFSALAGRNANAAERLS